VQESLPQQPWIKIRKEEPMSAEIYYFSGTGNSLHIAEELASKLGGSVKRIAPLMDGTIRTDADTVGIVFPVYYAELPVIVKKFAEKLDAKGKYVFAVCNYGGAAGKSLKLLKAILKDRGIQLSAGFGVHMPQNAFRKPWEVKEKVLAQSVKRIDFIAKNVAVKKKGLFYTNIPMEVMLRLMHAVIRGACSKDFSERTGMPEGTPIDELVYLLDESFSASNKCTGCGTCEAVCPVGNIRIDSGKPVWLNRCENCLACYNWCPSKAITGGVSQGYYYRHPKVKVSEMKGEEVDFIGKGLHPFDPTGGTASKPPPKG
jgi:ferredoxin